MSESVDNEVLEPEAESMRDRIFRVATELFAEKGYHATGVQEISATAGLGRGALYYHIKSKEDLLYKISMALLDEMNDRARAILANGQPADEQMTALARDLIRNLAEHRDGWTVSLSEVRSLSPEKRDAVIAARDEYERIWGQVLNRGVEEGKLREGSPLIRRGVLGMLNSTHHWIDASGGVSPEELADVYMGVVLNGLLVD